MTTNLAIIIGAALIAVGFFDAIYNGVTKHLGWYDQPAFIEGVVFCFVLWKVLWGWLSRRVWICRQSDVAN